MASKFATLGVALFLTILAVTAASSASSIPSISTSSHSDIPWNAARFWLQSADCAKSTGALLSLCVDGKLVPIADHDSGDDPGHALFLGIYSLVTQRAVTSADASILNATINYLGLILITTYLCAQNLRIAATLTFFVGLLPVNHFHAVSPHPSQFGLACFASILPLAILRSRSSESERGDLVWIIVGLAALGMASIFRQAIGLMGAVASTVAVLTFKIERPIRKRALATAAILLVSTFVSYQSPYLILRARDFAYQLPQSQGMERHGAWHNLYIGLGVVSNPFGLKWSDASGIEAVNKIDQSIKFGTNEYYDVLRNEYFRRLVERPDAIAKIYFEKLSLTMQATLPWTIIPLWLPLVAISVLALWARRISGTTVRSRTDPLLIVSALFSSFFIAQSVLFNVDMQYLFPIQLFFLLGGGAILEMLGSRFRPQQFPSQAFGR